MLGKKEWAIPDGYMNDTQSGDFVSHEAICVLNVSEQTAHIEFTVYFEDAPPLRHFFATCAPERTNHIRLDKAVNNEGVPIPRGKSYALRITSDTDIIVQHSRLDVSQPSMALMTTIAY